MIDVKHIPDALKAGESWPILNLDPDWIWESRDENGEVVGILIAAPCHGLVFIWRIKMLKTAPAAALLSLFRRFIKDIRARGCLGYMATLDLCRPEEQQLARVAIRARGMFEPKTVSLICGSVETGHLAEGSCQS